MASGSAKCSPRPGDPFHYEAGTLTLRLQVQPGARREGWAGRHDAGTLKLRLTAPAVDGKANRACVAYLARAAGVPRGAVRIVRGERSRAKTVRIAPLSEAQFQALKEQWPA